MMASLATALCNLGGTLQISYHRNPLPNLPCMYHIKQLVLAETTPMYSKSMSIPTQAHLCIRLQVSGQLAIVKYLITELGSIVSI